MAFDWHEIDTADRKLTVEDSSVESVCAITDAATYDPAIAVIATNGKINFCGNILETLDEIFCYENSKEFEWMIEITHGAYYWQTFYRHYELIHFDSDTTSII